MMTQDWVDKICREGLDEPPVLGAGAEPTDDDLRRDAWALRYMATIVDAGFPVDWAASTYKAGMGAHDYDDDPEDAAGAEMSYWSDDGDR